MLVLSKSILLSIYKIKSTLIRIIIESKMGYDPNAPARARKKP